MTSGLTWDFTVNTDFSQVEADEQQINLTRFSLFFSERNATSSSENLGSISLVSARAAPVAAAADGRTRLRT